MTNLVKVYPFRFILEPRPYDKRYIKQNKLELIFHYLDDNFLQSVKTNRELHEALADKQIFPIKIN